ncbi:MAG: imidazolonepropionase [Phaeodactylibacter sp.]|uniref:imidazolonepropionase n=1 Tax=Phaeodactylibacter sp. TaxID=1940289 RepID=UPI0032F02128
MPTLLLRNIRFLVLAETAPQPAYSGRQMQNIPILEDAFLLIEDGRIMSFGSMEACPERADEVVDASGRAVLPAWCDSHTHLVFARSREEEFVDRIKGLSYEEIARRGGGILNSARRLQEASEEELFTDAWLRLKEIITYGTGAVEIKSGYGLTVKSELKMLRVIRRLRAKAPIPIKATFLGAHALPPAFKADRKAYLDLIVNEMLPRIADEGLADYVDAFCEKGFFTVEEMDRVMEAGARYGLKAKVHTNQFNSMGGINAAVARGAISVDHLEVVSDAEVEILKSGQTIPTLLPSAPFFIGGHYQPARKLIDAGLPVALATDYNPGSTPSGRMPFVLSLACIKCGMLPEETICAATINGARALELEAELGSIAKGKRGSFILTAPMPSLAFLPYSFGTDLIERVYIDGQCRVDKRSVFLD